MISRLLLFVEQETPPSAPGRWLIAWKCRQATPWSLRVEGCGRGMLWWEGWPIPNATNSQYRLQETVKCTFLNRERRYSFGRAFTLCHKARQTQSWYTIHISMSHSILGLRTLALSTRLGRFNSNNAELDHNWLPNSLVAVGLEILKPGKRQAVTEIQLESKSKPSLIR